MPTWEICFWRIAIACAILLPIVHAATETGSESLAIAAREAHGTRQHGRVMRAVTIATAVPPPGWTDERLTGVRETMAAYFAADAVLRIDSRGGTSRAEVRWSGRSLAPLAAARVA